MMSQRKHVSDSSHEDLNTVRRSKERESRSEHALVQLQHTVGNRAVTDLIQRHPEQDQRIGSVHQAHNKLWGDHLITQQSLKWAHEKTNTNKASIGVLFGKVNQLMQSSSSGGDSGDIYED